MHFKFQCSAVSSSFFLLPSSFPEIQVCFRCVHVQVQQAHKQVLLGRHHHNKTFMKQTLVSMKDIVLQGRKEGRKYLYYKQCSFNLIVQERHCSKLCFAFYFVAFQRKFNRSTFGPSNTIQYRYDTVCE